MSLGIVDWVVGAIASAAFILSLVIHGLTFWSFNIQDQFPAIWILHIGIFACGIPLFLRAKVEEKQKDAELVTLTSSPEVPPPTPNTIAERLGLTNWLTGVYLVLGFYVTVNFFLFALGSEGSPEQRGDQYLLTYKGNVLRELSKEEYDRASAHLLHGFSGHWLIFYFYFASTAFVSASRQRPENR